MSPHSQIYQLNPLNHSSEQIRLASVVRSNSHHSAIECRLHVVDLNNAPSFTALSYVWGDPGVTEEIILDNEPFHIATNLRDALLRLRARTDHDYIWIDALCIDQSSTAEKNKQVPLMNAIYAKATIVYMWLGENHDDSDCAVDFIKQWVATARTVGPPEEDHHEHRTAWSLRMLDMSKAQWKRDSERSMNPFSGAAWAAISKFLNREYWSRVWIVQEVILAKYGMILCGGKSLPFPDLYRFWFSWGVISHQLDLSIDERRNLSALNSGGIKTVLVLNLRIKYASGYIGRELDPAVALHSQDAHDPRDKIYAILGLLSSNHPFLPVDYNLPTANVYRTFVLAYLAARNRLDWLGLAGRSLEAIEQRRQRLSPSWISDFERLPTHCAVSMNADTRTYSAAGDKEAIWTVTADNSTLTVRGAMVDVVTHVSPVLDSLGEDNLADADWICRCWDLAGRCRRSLQTTTIKWWQLFALTICNDEWKLQSPVEMDELQMKKFVQLASALLAYLQSSLVSPRSIWVTKGKGADPQAGAATTLLSEEERSTAIEETLNQVVDLLNGLEGIEDERYTQALTAGGANPTMLEHLITNIRSSWDERSFFITEGGYMGIGSPDMVAGDEIVIALGCSVPLIWRMVRPKTYEAIGDAFILGMMMGEMMDEVDSGKFELQDLTLV